MRPAPAREWPARPSLPPLLACALGLWAAAAASYSIGEGWDAHACLALALAGALGAAGGLAALWRGRRALAACALLGVALGLACGGFAGASLHAAMERAEGGASALWRFEVLEDGTAGAFGPQCYARATAADGRSAVVRVALPEDAEAPLYGDVFAAHARLERPSGSTASHCWQHGASATARVEGVEPLEPGGPAAPLLELRSRALGALSGAGGDAGALLQALVCGARGSLGDTGLYADFKATGLAHVVAVSGSHLSIVGAFALVLLRALRVPRAAQVVVEGAFLVAYLVFAGAPVSAARAAAMAVAGLSSFFARRRPAPLNALALVVALAVGASPRTAVSVSFALSAGSTLGIVLFARLFCAWLDALPFRVPRFLRDALALTLSSGVATVPASAALFAQASLVSPLANAVASPLFALACAGGLAAAMLAVALPWTAGVAVGAAGACAQALAGVVHALAQVPYASVPVSAPVLPLLAASVATCALLWRFWPRPTRRALACALGVGAAFACLVAQAALRPMPAEIVMLDVGQGDAFLVRSEGAALLIDTGNRDQALREALARHGVWRLDAVLLTHSDDDHTGSLASLRGVVGVGRVLVARDALSCECAACRRLIADARSLVGEEGVVGVQVGDAISCGRFALSVVWPDGFSDEGGNADSVCLLARADVDGDGGADWKALFCGDAEAEQLAELERRGALSQVDIYKVGHHGSRAALDDEVAAALSPRIALVSVGAQNRYGHPADETLARLEAVGARVLRTDERGDVSCELSADAVEVSTLR